MNLNGGNGLHKLVSLKISNINGYGNQECKLLFECPTNFFLSNKHTR